MGSTRSQSVENLLWKRLWTRRKTDYEIKMKSCNVVGQPQITEVKKTCGAVVRWYLSMNYKTQTPKHIIHNTIKYILPLKNIVKYTKIQINSPNLITTFKKHCNNLIYNCDNYIKEKFAILPLCQQSASYKQQTKITTIQGSILEPVFHGLVFS